jgi:hypothetical protein
MKSCPRCETEKPLSSFYQIPSARGKYSSYCKPCCYATSRASELKRVERLRARHAAWTYVLYGADDECLYVGQTNRPDARMSHHRQKTPWWSDVARIVWKQFTDQEQRLISHLEPLHNKQLMRRS